MAEDRLVLHSDTRVHASNLRHLQNDAQQVLYHLYGCALLCATV